MHRDVGQEAAARKRGELDQEARADAGAAGAADQLDAGSGGSAGCDQVVDDEGALAGLDGVGVHLDDVAPVLEGVLDLVRVPRKLPALAHEAEARTEDQRHRGAEQEATGLDAEHAVDAGVGEGCGDGLDRRAERRRLEQQRRHVAEQDAGLREVRDVADQFAKLACVHQLLGRFGAGLRLVGQER